jgi:hypothetical protein
MSSSIVAALSGGGSLLPGSMLGQIGNAGGGGAPAIPTGAGGNAIDPGYTGIGSKIASGVVNPQGVQAAESIYGTWDARNAAVGAMPNAMGTAGIYRKSSNTPIKQTEEEKLLATPAQPGDMYANRQVYDASFMRPEKDKPNMKDLPLNSPERWEEYENRGWAHDETSKKID